MTSKELATMTKIAQRAERAFTAAGMSRSMISCAIDIEFAHIATPLRLDEMLHGSESDFMHDVLGIAAHLNRETKTFDDCFVPRFAKA